MLPIINRSGEKQIDERIIDQIRALGIDMIHEASSGHPGIVLGAAPILYTLYSRHLVSNPNDPNWINRDRFVLSAGHGSALLYATLFLAGYDLSLEDLKQFRSLDSKTPGHPEYSVTPGVDMTTGPLGQGIASAVGMAISERYLHEMNSLIDHYTYVLCGDGDLMEGISYEAMSLAGTLKLNKLIVLYDSNNVCLDGETKETFQEDISKRFESAGWEYITVLNGEDVTLINKAIERAKNSNRPTLIEVKTTIGKYSYHQGSHLVHGTPLSDEDMENIKKQMDVRNVPFSISSEVASEFQKTIEERVLPKYDAWMKRYEKLEEMEKQQLMMNGPLSLQNFTYEMPEEKKEAPRVTSSKVLCAIAKENPRFLGGSADLSSSCKTYLSELGDYSSNNYRGKNIWFGVREHAMGAILNGMALSGLRPFGSTFLTFSDYLKPSIRLAALMNLPVLYVFTHDSITVGEDGPTHQPIEQLVALRSIPNLEVYRPADANEVIGAYQTILEKTKGPSAIILGRNEVLIQECTSQTAVSKGAYILKEAEGKLDGILIATGDDVEMALSLQESLSHKGIGIRVVSMPCQERFEAMEESYQEEVLPVSIKKAVLEKGSSYSWYRYVYSKKYLFTIDSFGASGTKEDVVKKYEMDFESLESKLLDLFK